MLKLYYKPTCPFCQKVLQYADEAGIELDLMDIVDDPALADELIEKGGKRQVPFLVDEDNNKEMYESDDIISYLKKNVVGDTTTKKPKVHQSDNVCVSCEG